MENVGLTMGISVQPKAQDAGNIINGTTGNKCAEVNRHRTRNTSHLLDHHLNAGKHRTNQIKVG